MISFEELKKVEPALQGKTDEELTVIRNLLYDHAKLALECWLEDMEERYGSKNPPGDCGHAEAGVQKLPPCKIN